MINLIEKLNSIEKNEIVVVAGHRTPDGDCTGSAIALALALRKKGIESYVALDTYVDKLKIIGDYDFIITDIDENFKFDVLIAVDMAEFKLLGKAEKIVNNAKKFYVIDHHACHVNFGNIDYVEPDRSSCCEIIYDIINAINVEIDKNIATALYTGIVTDTGVFRFPEVTPRTYEIAADLVSKGINFGEIINKVYFSKTEKDLFILKYTLDNMKTRNGVLYITFDEKTIKENDLKDEDFDAIKAIFGTIESSDITMVIRKIDNKIRGSFRSKKADVNKIAKQIGGGGHINAAGFTMIDETIDSALDKIFALI